MSESVGALPAITPNQKPKTRSKRILELDALRALSCLNLLLFHFTFVYQNKYGFNSEIAYAFPYGKYGVQLFFMLSGLVNAMTLLSKRKPGDFLASRFIRIFPSYWLVILLNVGLFACFPFFRESVDVHSTVANLTAMPGLFGYTNMEPVTWTLQVELLFYTFLLALLMTGLLDKPLRTMLVAVAACFVCCTGFEWFAGSYPESIWNGRFQVAEDLFFMRNMPLFAMGILLNELRCDRGSRWGLCMGMLACAVVFHAIDLRGHNPAATVLMFGLLVACAFGKVPILRFKPLLYVSFISYSLYLFHNNLGSLLMGVVDSLGFPPIVTIVVAILFAIGIGSVVTYWFEQPITKFLFRQWAGIKTWNAERSPGTWVTTKSPSRTG